MKERRLRGIYVTKPRQSPCQHRGAVHGKPEESTRCVENVKDDLGFILV